MSFHVFLVDSIGTATSVEEFATRAEADDSAEWLMDQRDYVQILDGTTFEAREEQCEKPYRLATIAGGTVEQCRRSPGHEGVCGPWGSLLP